MSPKMHGLAEVGIQQLNHVDQSSHPLPEPLDRYTRSHIIQIVLVGFACAVGYSILSLQDPF